MGQSKLLFSGSHNKQYEFLACTLQDTPLHITAPPALCHDTIFPRLYIQKLDVPLCECGADWVNQAWRRRVGVCVLQQWQFQMSNRIFIGNVNVDLNATPSLHLHILLSALQEKIVTLFSRPWPFLPAYLFVFRDFTVLLFCCVFCVACLRPYYYLLPNPLSLFPLLSFYFATMLLPLILIFMFLLITV